MSEIWRIEYPGHIIVGLDAKDGKVAIDGWSKLSRHDVIDLAQHFEADGVEAIIYTDISRDGMMQGVNVEATAKLARAIRFRLLLPAALPTWMISKPWAQWRVTALWAPLPVGLSMKVRWILPKRKNWRNHFKENHELS